MNVKQVLNTKNERIDTVPLKQNLQFPILIFPMTRNSMFIKLVNYTFEADDICNVRWLSHS